MVKYLWIDFLKLTLLLLTIGSKLCCLKKIWIIQYFVVYIFKLFLCYAYRPNVEKKYSLSFNIIFYSPGYGKCTKQTHFLKLKYFHYNKSSVKKNLEWNFSNCPIKKCTYWNLFLYRNRPRRFWISRLLKTNDMLFIITRD